MSKRKKVIKLFRKNRANIKKDQKRMDLNNEILKKIKE